MRKTMKKLVTFFTTLCLIALFSITAFAGQWRQDPEFESIWMYQRDDGTYVKNDWELIDGKWFHFDSDGWLETSTVTADGYTVGPSGAWIESIPQKTPEEMKQDTIDTLIEWYEKGFCIDQADFEEMAGYMLSPYCDSAEIQSIIENIRNNHTFVSYEDLYGTYE